MVKNYKFLVVNLFFIFLLSFNLSLAVEGTCSWHRGVNCNAGADGDGSAICNDGWRDSSEIYATTEKCQNELFQYCPLPSFYGYTNISLCNELQSICDRQNTSRRQSYIMGGITDSKYLEPIICPEVDVCEKQVDSYNVIMLAHNDCIDTYKKYLQLEYDYQNYPAKQSASSNFSTASELKISSKNSPEEKLKHRGVLSKIKE